MHITEILAFKVILNGVLYIITIYLKNSIDILINVKLIRYNFDAPDAHFDYSSLFSDAQVEKVGNPKKKNVKTERAVG
jgi:hypothetical protein